MPDQFDACLTFTLREEGGFCNDPRDPGGATCQGITLATLRNWSNDDTLDVAAIEGIAPATVQAIYSSDFWNRMRCDAMPPGIDLMVFDHGVNAGPPRAVRVLQQALGFTGADVDGCVGPATLAAAAAADPVAAVARMAEIQAAYYESLPTFPTFGKGWLARVDRRHRTAATMTSPVAA